MMRATLGTQRAATFLFAIACLAALGIADCTFVQIVDGGLDAPLIAFWAATTLPPLAVSAAAIALAPRHAIPQRLRLPLLAFGIAVLTIVLVGTDILVFSEETGTGWLERARSKAPGVAAFVGLGIVLHVPIVERSLRADVPPADAAAIAAARLVRAAGNYVEVQGPTGRLRLIRIPLGRLARLPEAEGLVQLHRSLLVRATAIVRWHNDRSGLVRAELADGTVIRIGRTYRGRAYRLRNSCSSSQTS